MKIKEVEKSTGISSANIRFYEKEGLVRPERKRENNYRDYSEADVRRLEQIKVLRLLGIPVSDIRTVYDEQMELGKVIEKRMRALDEEENHMCEVRKTCENILRNHIELAGLDAQILEGEQSSWIERLQIVLNEDITQVELDKKQLNRHVSIWLLWGYLINVGITFLFQDSFAPETEPMLLVLVVLMLVLGIVVHYSANLKVQILTLHLSAMGSTPLLIILSKFLLDGETHRRFCEFLPYFWLGTMEYVLVVWLLSEIWKKMFTRDRISLGIAVIGTVILTAGVYALHGEWVMPGIMFFVTTIYVSLFWTVVNTEVQSYTRFYAVSSANRILNPFVVIFSYWGKAQSGLWR